MRLADYVARRLAEAGIGQVYLVTGGMAMHLNDAFGRSPDLAVTCFHHEQAAAMAAESHYRLTNRLAAVNVTSGPGATNALTGVLGAWDDSIGMVVVSGQVKRETLASSTGLPLRQLGDQEVEIVPMVAGITKYAVQVTEPDTIRYHLERALHLAVSGRPGPVWLDLPLDVQAAAVDPDAMRGYDPAEDAASCTGTTDVPLAADEIAARIAAAHRPVIYAGPALRLAGVVEEFRELVARWQIPVVTALNAHDLLGREDPRWVGRPGILGDRTGNFAVQNADLLLVVGTRLKIGQVGFDFASFAPSATVVMVDIDTAELAKPTLSIDVAVHAEVGAVIRALLKGAPDSTDGRHASWLRWCQERRERYPVVLPEYRSTDAPLNPYCFFEVLFDGLGSRDVVVAGNGWAGNGAAQAGWPRVDQRLYSNSGCGSMGHDLPAAIGAALADPERTVLCIAGDGSLQMNIQELQTVVHHRLALKLFVLNNDGYDSIRQSQQRFFPDGPVGFDVASGVSFPDLARLAPAYGLPYRRVTRLSELAQAVRWAQETRGPVVCEVLVDPTQIYSPKVTSRMDADGRMVSAPLDDMAPFLADAEKATNRVAGRETG
jgi:acetolactate synthase-1/2/3 large subunit